LVPIAKRKHATGKKPSRTGRRTGTVSPGRRAGAGGSPLVLVVDDYQDAREMYAEYLEFSGFRTEAACTGVEAVKKAFELRPDVVLMDLSLPVMDGWEATRLLKADAVTRGIPVVALTGHALPCHAESARKAGCDAVVTKPCLPDVLVAEVRKALKRSSGEPSVRPKGGS